MKIFYFLSLLAIIGLPFSSLATTCCCEKGEKHCQDNSCTAFGCQCSHAKITLDNHKKPERAYFKISYDLPEENHNISFHPTLLDPPPKI